MFPKLLAEVLGTAMLILLGDGVVANVTLNKSGMKGGGPVQITLAWGLAVLMPVICYGAISGAHFNPAVSIGLAIAAGAKAGPATRRFADYVVRYVTAQS